MSFKRSIWCSLAGLLIAGAVQGQTVFWGVGGTTGVAEGEFQTAFIEDTTAINYDINRWTAVSIFESAAGGGHGPVGNQTIGDAFWVRDTTGRTRGAYVSGAEPIFPSASQANGVALFDSDFLDNGGIANNFGMGAAPAAHRGALVSPRIDLSAAQDSILSVQFFCQYRPFTINDLTVEFSMDDGVTWTASGNIETLLPTVVNESTFGHVQWILPANTTVGTNLTQCRIRFVFEGEYYYCVLDDVSIETAATYDLAIAPPIGARGGHAPSSIEENGRFLHISGNKYIPYDNIDVNNPVNWSWGARINQNGAESVTAADGVRLICQIDQVRNGQTITGVYYDTLFLGPNDTLQPNQGNAIALTKTFDRLTFLQLLTNLIGTYHVTYWVELDRMDAKSSNDTVRHTFTITEPNVITFPNGIERRHEQYFSKARLHNIDKRVRATSSVFPGGAYSSIEFGSTYYFPFGQRDSITLDSVDFRYFLPTSFAGAANQTLKVKLYSYQMGLLGNQGFIDDQNLTLIGESAVLLTGLGTTKPVNDYYLGTARNFVDAAGNPMGSLPQNGFYFISVALEGTPSNLLVPHEVPFFGVDDINYAMNFAHTSDSTLFVPFAIKTVDTHGSNWFAGFTGFDEVPSMGLYLTNTFFVGGGTVLSTNAVETAGATQMTLYPNPVQAQLTVDWQTTDPATDVEYIITDATGRVLYWKQQDQVTQDQHQIDVSRLAPGNYWLHLKTESHTETKLFIKY